MVGGPFVAARDVKREHIDGFSREDIELIPEHFVGADAIVVESTLEAGPAELAG
jgi:hypothetical protein